VVEKGRGVYLWDVDGNRFMDFNAGIAVCSTGHSHPKVVSAIKAQASRFLHMSGTDFYYGPEIRLAEELAAIAPGRSAKKSYLCNSGTEAVEACLKLARYKTHRPLMIAFYGAFHGRTMGSLALTASKATQRKYFGPMLAGVSHVPFADCRRCPFNVKFPTCNFACVSFIEDVVMKKTTPPEDVAALVVEPVQGEGGYVIPPPGYFEKLRELCSRYGIQFVVDEVQSGFGRTGKMFAIEHWNADPDMIAVAKGMASGMPLGACIARADVMDWQPGSHGTTFGGNPVSCEASLATIRLIRESLMENARTMGEYMKRSLEQMQARHRTIGWVNALGLMIGMEIVREPGSTVGDPKMRDRIVEECFRRGLLILGCGPSALRISPPLVVRRADARIALEILDDALTAVENGKKRAR
jgi:4-aminobutyrate aminotransferase